MKRKFKYILLAFFLATGTAGAGSVDTSAVLQRIETSINNLNNVAYSYTLNASYPTGETDEIKGKAYINVDAPLLYNDCSAFTVIYDGHWLYKADHRKKELTIINIEKELGQAAKEDRQKAVLQDLVTMFFGDTSLFKKARISTLIDDNNLEKIKLKFPAYIHIDAIDIIVDKNTNQMVNYGMYVSQPWQKTANTTQSIRQKIKCSDFTITMDKDKYAPANYFTVSNGKLTIKKFNNYKLYRKI